MSKHNRATDSPGPSKGPTRSSARLAETNVTGSPSETIIPTKKRPGSPGSPNHYAPNKKQKAKEKITHGTQDQATSEQMSPKIALASNIVHASGTQVLGNTQSIVADHADQRSLVESSLPVGEGLHYAFGTNNPATGHSGAAPIPTPAPSAVASSAYYNLNPTYPEPVQSTGTLDRFLTWIPIPQDHVSETYTLLYWERILQYFTTGWLCKITALDLDQKEKLTRLSKHVVHERAGYKEGGSGAKPRSLIPVNHNKPDSVITYLSAKLEERLCMVIEAKPATDWDTSFQQIVTYMMKGRRDDGCSMGLVVAGSAYRFFYWDKDERLHAVVPTSVWTGPTSLSLSAAMEVFAVNSSHWSFGNLTSRGLPHMLHSRRNFYRIFQYLETQVISIVERQRQGSGREILDLVGCPPDLEDATHVLVTGSWEQLRGTSRPATNGLGMTPTLVAYETRGSGGGGGAGPADDVDQNETGLPDIGNPHPGAPGDNAEEEKSLDDDEISNEEEWLEKNLAIWPEWARDTHREFYYYAKASRAERAKEKIGAWAAEITEPMECV